MLILKSELKNIIANFLKEEFQHLGSSKIKLTRLGGIKTFKEKDRVYFGKIKEEGINGIIQYVFDMDVEPVGFGQKVEYTLTNSDSNGIFGKLNLVVFNVDTYDAETGEEINSNKDITWFDTH